MAFGAQCCGGGRGEREREGGGGGEGHVANVLVRAEDGPAFRAAVGDRLMFTIEFSQDFRMAWQSVYCLLELDGVHKIGTRVISSAI